MGIAVIPLLLIKEATSYNYTVLYYFLLARTAAGIALLFHQYKTLGVITIAGYLIFFLMFCQEYFTTNLFIYSDDALIPVISKTETEQQIILDTTGVILPECYIGLALEANPKEIQYDNSSNAISTAKTTVSPAASAEMNEIYEEGVDAISKIESAIKK